MKSLNGKNVIVTGGTRGIGKSIVEMFAQYGANVAFTYVSDDTRAQALAQELSKYGTQIKAYKSDASDYEATQQLAEDILAEFGTIDVLINNAGITKDNLLLRMSKDEWDIIQKVNLDSVFNFTKAVLKPMMKQKKGSIINMSSVVGAKGNAGQANYAASKAGIIGFSKSVALELGSRNVRCNVIAPGFIETEMTHALDEKVVQEWRNTIPMKRGGTPEEIASVCLFLASDLSSYITGEVIHVNGGMYT